MAGAIGSYKSFVQAGPGAENTKIGQSCANTDAPKVACDSLNHGNQFLPRLRRTVVGFGSNMGTSIRGAVTTTMDYHPRRIAATIIVSIVLIASIVVTTWFLRSQALAGHISRVEEQTQELLAAEAKRRRTFVQVAGTLATLWVAAEVVCYPRADVSMCGYLPVGKLVKQIKKENRFRYGAIEIPGIERVVRRANYIIISSTT